jgi:hypothetical protein
MQTSELNNTSDNDSIATFDLKLLELGLQLTIVEIANPPHLRDIAAD